MTSDSASAGVAASRSLAAYRERMLRHPFLRGFEDQHLAILAECAMDVDFRAGERLFREGDPANRFYLIEAGAVVIESLQTDGELLEIETVGPGDVLGWSWLFPPYYWHFDARALEPGKAMFFYGTRLRDNAERDHHLGYELMSRVAEVLIRRLQATRKQVVRHR